MNRIQVLKKALAFWPPNLIRKRESQMSEVLVSVIMGVHNPKLDQLKDAVNSIIGQSFTDWEMIIYGDGSSEEYHHGIANIAGLDSRISYYRSHKNQGLAKVLNKCIPLAKGKYIARMDADDISLETRLEKQVEFLNHNPNISWVGTGAYLLAGRSVWGNRRMKAFPQALDFLQYSPYIHPTVMFRREVLKSSKGYNSSKITRRCEDYELFMRLHKKGYRGYNIQELLFIYREDMKAYERRTFESRFNEALVRYWGFNKLGIYNFTTMPYVVRPLVGGLIPSSVLFMIKRGCAL